MKNRNSVIVLVFTLLALGISSNIQAESASNPNKEIQLLQKKVDSLESRVRLLQISIDSFRSTNSLDSFTIKNINGVTAQRLSFVALLNRDLRCPEGTTAATELNGLAVEKDFPDGFSFKNIRAFGVLSGAQINLGVCEITILKK